MRNKFIATLVAAALVVLAGCSSDTHDDEAAATAADPGKARDDFAKVDASTKIDATRYLYPTATDSRDDNQNWADLFVPSGEHQDGSVPLVVLIHGGAWKSEIGADVFVTFARRLAERGLAVYNLEYRRVGAGGGWPTTFSDVAAALDFIPNVKKANPELNIDNVVVAGHSAGGQLAMWSGTRHDLENNEVGAKPKFSPEHVISLAGPLDMRVAVTMGDMNIVTALDGTPAQVPERYKMVDPIQNIDPDIPTIAMNGDKDRIVPAILSQNYVAAAKRLGATSSFVMIPGGNHVSIVDVNNPQFMTVLETINRAAQKAANR
ncbi:alpha/beta hydrolase family protein [Gordonia hydrophobica]|uniref:Alpha/beta fold hydrolase n=1 Tax=Gordonia hydrophobica TaxID=40516 RepID=A0ABZ2U3T3_9ACTN|nr:alpha/beta fold hydrolase [Gordonia hydrophobica]MBM7368986.1 acetyl esterase/lipase [Gordonia hydrophobica]